MPLSAAQKSVLGLFLVLRDWSAGVFPQAFERESAWESERHYSSSMTGLTQEQVVELGNMKPFHIASDEFEFHSRSFIRIRDMLRTLHIFPPARIVELGCGQGWLSEMLAMTGFNVVGTSIAPSDIHEARRRADAFALRKIPGSLSFAVSPMEHIDRSLAGIDCILVYEALHHAFDWKETIRSVSRTLRAGGWFIICAEPNIAHTIISYRVGQLTKTHEVGISRRALMKELHATGFKTIKPFSTPLHFWMGWHWVAAQLQRPIG
jgi:2-polyprenyl-3-methyl-5-hydroxy-6-metoxy-1,4-benzoquinol methylase